MGCPGIRTPPPSDILGRPGNWRGTCGHVASMRMYRREWIMSLRVHWEASLPPSWPRELSPLASCPVLTDCAPPFLPVSDTHTRPVHGPGSSRHGLLPFFVPSSTETCCRSPLSLATALQDEGRAPNLNVPAQSSYLPLSEGHHSVASPGCNRANKCLCPDTLRKRRQATESTPAQHTRH